MKTINILLLVAAGALATPALAAGGAAKADEKPKKEHKICRSETKSGSHMTKTVCKTAKEWAGIPDEESPLIVGNREATGRAINIGTPGRSPQN
jgi:hypothetical protein